MKPFASAGSLKPLVMLTLLFFMAGCGENIAPTIQAVRVSNPTATRFQEFFVTLVGVEDVDGNVYARKVKMKAEASGESFDEEIRPFETEPNRSRGDVIFGATLAGDIPLGTWKLRLIFEDEAGAESDPADAQIQLTR
jgi:hypothetical protein